MTTTLLGRTHASKLMVEPPAVVEDTMTVREAAALMSRHSASVLPVIRTTTGEALELLGCVTAAQLAEALLNNKPDEVDQADQADDDSRPVPTVADLPLIPNRLNREAEATDVLEALTRTDLEGLPVVSNRASDSSGEQLVGWVCQRIVVERIYEVQARARAAAATYTSLGSRLQDRWRARPVPRRRISRISRISSRSSRRSRRR